jgi:hypothetical protein
MPSANSPKAAAFRIFVSYSISTKNRLSVRHALADAIECAECNQISALRTRATRKNSQEFRVECGAARFWFIDSATVHCCGTSNAAASPFCGKSRHTAVLHVGFRCEEK